MKAADIPDEAVLMVVDAVERFGWEFLAADRSYHAEVFTGGDWEPDHFPHSYWHNGQNNVQYSTAVAYTAYVHGGPPDGGIGASRWDLAEELWEFGAPEKVLQAKLAKLVKRGLLDGCACGCRGDFRVTESGRAFLSPALPREPET